MPRPSKRSKGAEDVHGQRGAGSWDGMPPALLGRVLALLPAADLVSAAQTCRAWRGVAGRADSWEWRRLDYDRDAEDDATFMRVLRFAPTLGHLRFVTAMNYKPRRALLEQSRCKPRGFETRCGSKWVVSMMTSWRDTLEDLRLVNPTLSELTAAASLPRLRNLSVRFDPTLYEMKRNYRLLPVLPIQHRGSPSLERLVLIKIDGDAAGGLVRSHAASLREVVVLGPWVARDVPLQEILECPAVKRVTLELELEHLNHVNARLRKLLKGRNLEHLAMFSFELHCTEACRSLREAMSAEGAVRAGSSVTCHACARGHRISCFESRDSWYDKLLV